ncbi:hypothetical protein BKA70DRAFT_1234099 [Coprinopsis sp. MPI-PUGE-AT-0042]|nr:hypothetical protein BKA70DRAFT_1234099 [Coprinopsis sp. MPI-PUGE-AT-0042]
MDHHRQPHGDDRYTYSTNDAYDHGHAYGWGNPPSLRPFPSYVPTHASRDDYCYDEYEHDDYYEGDPPRSLYGAPDSYDYEQQLPEMPARSHSGAGDQREAPRRYAYGLWNVNEGEVEDDGNLEMNYDKDPSPFLHEGPPRTTADGDRFIRRFTGNRNLGRIGRNAKMVMNYKPRRAATTGNHPSSPVSSHNRSRSRGRHSSHGFTMYPPRTQVATSTFPTYGREQTLGQAPSGERYYPTKRR